MLSSVDTKTMIHVGVEIVVIGGITFYLNKRISGVQEEIGLLREKVESLETIIQQQNQMISQHENILRQIMGASQGPTQQRPPQQRPPQQRPPQQYSQKSSKYSYSQPEDSSDDDGPQELSPEELDVFLESELSDIKEARQCEGDQCTLKPRKTRKKGRRRKKSHGD